MGLIQLITIIAVIGLDQLTKYWAVKTLAPAGEIELIKGVFSLRFVENTGAAFSILQGQTLLLTIIPAAACIVMAYVLIKGKIRSKLGSWGIALIFAGALGNLIDRVMRGAVVDMFNFELINFPVFNVADIAVTVGAILFFVYTLFFYDAKADKKDG